MHPKTFREWFERVTIAYGLSPENAFSILFPWMLTALLFFGIGILGLFGLEKTFIQIGFQATILLVGVGGAMIVIKREVPGQPWMRGTLWAVFLGALLIVISILGFLSTFFTAK